MKFYITTDLKSSKIYIAPHGKVAQPFLILCETRWHGDNILKKLNAALLKSPLEDSSIYRLLEKKQDLILSGEVSVYHLINAI